jgi:hypothetical protein
MTPIPPSSVLFMLQSGYSAELIMPIILDSINGLNSESNRLRRPADPKFTPLVELMREGQLSVPSRSASSVPRMALRAPCSFSDQARIRSSPQRAGN